MPLDDYREGTAFLVIEPGRYNNELRVVRSTQKVPRTIAGDAVVIRINVRLPPVGIPRGPGRRARGRRGLGATAGG